MKDKPRILITNDDGIYAPGLKHLWSGLVNKADISIVAPESEQSGMSLALTLRQPLLLQTVEWDKGTKAWKINGTPADCVRLGLSTLLDHQPDLIVSGINRGANLGRNILYSGTIGGVIEGALRNVPGIAFSCFNLQNPDYKAVEDLIWPVVQHLLDNPLPKGTFLNVNFPEANPIRGIKLARQGMSYWIESISQRVHPEGHPYYWLGGKWLDHPEHEESDVSLLQQGYAAAVPINVNKLTDYFVLKNHKGHFDQVFSKV